MLTLSRPDLILGSLRGLSEFTSLRNRPGFGYIPLFFSVLHLASISRLHERYGNTPQKNGKRNLFFVSWSFKNKAEPLSVWPKRFCIWFMTTSIACLMNSVLILQRGIICWSFSWFFFKYITIVDWLESLIKKLIFKARRTLNSMQCLSDFFQNQLLIDPAGFIFINRLREFLFDCRLYHLLPVVSRV